MTASITLASTEPLPLTSARNYAAGSPARIALDSALHEVRHAAYDVPNIIGGAEIRTGRLMSVVAPHQHGNPIGQVHRAAADETTDAIAAALDTSASWSILSSSERAAPFLRAAELLGRGPWRDRLVAATMLELSKTSGQADGDVACETIDLFRANVANMDAAYSVQPSSPPGIHNHLEYRPLEGFVLAVSPFNYASMNNLALGPALLGNTVVWKPAESTSLVSYLTMELMREAGLPDGVVNLVHGDGEEIGAVALAHRDLAAVHFTGSTGTFQHLFRTVGNNIANYRGYPRVVGETGGKGFIVAHASADLDALATGCVHGAFDYQGQKCSAASRIYVPRSMWPALRARLVDKTAQLVVGDPTRPETSIGAVINARQFTKHAEALHQAQAEGVVVVGGRTDNSTGWFVEPSILEVNDPYSAFLTTELFGPITAVHLYDESDWADTLRLVDQSTNYGLTGAVFATDEQALAEADTVLRYTAGNYTINDQPTGAIVGQQPFGGARASGTNDKVGTVWNLIRFLSPRSVKRKSASS